MFLLRTFYRKSDMVSDKRRRLVRQLGVYRAMGNRWLRLNGTENDTFLSMVEDIYYPDRMDELPIDGLWINEPASNDTQAFLDDLIPLQSYISRATNVGLTAIPGMVLRFGLQDEGNAESWDHWWNENRWNQAALQMSALAELRVGTDQRIALDVEAYFGSWPNYANTWKDWPLILHRAANFANVCQSKKIDLVGYPCGNRYTFSNWLISSFTYNDIYYGDEQEFVLWDAYATDQDLSEEEQSTIDAWTNHFTYTPLVNQYFIHLHVINGWMFKNHFSTALDHVRNTLGMQDNYWIFTQEVSSSDNSNLIFHPDWFETTDVP